MMWSDLRSRSVVVTRVLAILAVVSVADGGAQEDTRSGSTARGLNQFVAPQHGRTIDELVEQAIAKEPSLEAARRGIEAAEGRRRQAALRPNPIVSAARQEQAGGTDNQTAVTVEWPLDLRRKRTRLQVATHAVDAARLEAADRARLLAADVRATAGELLAAARNLRVAEDLRDASRRLADLIEARAAEGAVPALERDLVLVEFNRIEAQRIQNEGRVERAMLALKSVAGLPAETLVSLRDDLERAARSAEWGMASAPVFAGDGPSADGASAGPAFAPRPDLQAAEARIGLAQARLAQAVRDGRADASVFGSYTRVNAGFSQFGLNSLGAPERIRDVFHNLAVGMTWTIPLRNRNEGEIVAAAAERSAAAALRARVQLTAASELDAANVREEKARRALETYAEGVRAPAARNLDVLRKTYELGRTPLLDVLVEQRRYLEIEVGYTDALHELYRARVERQRAMGVTK